MDDRVRCLADCHLVRASLGAATALVAACKLIASAHTATNATVMHEQSAEEDGTP
jgi:hypothetical protein